MGREPTPDEAIALLDSMRRLARFADENEADARGRLAIRIGYLDDGTIVVDRTELDASEALELALYLFGYAHARGKL